MNEDARQYVSRCVPEVIDDEGIAGDREAIIASLAPLLHVLSLGPEEVGPGAGRYGLMGEVTRMAGPGD